MASNDQLLEAVASVESPLLVGRTLGELDLVRSVKLSVTGKITVELVLPVPSPPEALNDALAKALESFGRVAEINASVMDDEQSKTWMGRPKGTGGACAGRTGLIYKGLGDLVGEGRRRKILG